MPTFKPLQKFRETRSRRCCCWTCLVILLLLIILAVITFLVWIRIPSTNLTKIVPNRDGPGGAIQLKTDGFTTSWLVGLNVYNPNFFDIVFDELKVKGYEDNYANGTVPLATGQMGQKGKITLNRGGSTALDFPLDVTYQYSLDPQRSFVFYLMRKCGFTGERSNITVRYEVELVFSFLAWTGIRPVYKDSLSVLCPIDGFNNATLVADLVGEAVTDFWPADLPRINVGDLVNVGRGVVDGITNVFNSTVGNLVGPRRLARR
ncbi:hypothetical protein HK102_004392 [Quaeritorhiza haematococci]|nr:hypothetical protein HK102_004392 [Quaeritorhiza haematococci]